MQKPAKADKMLSSETSDKLLSELSIGAGRVESAPRIVHSYTDEFRAEMEREIRKKVARAQKELVARVNKAIAIDGKAVIIKEDPDVPRLGQPKYPRVVGHYKNMLTDVYSGIDGEGNVKVWTDRNHVPEDAAVLFVSRRSNGWAPEAVSNPDLSKPFFSALKRADENCAGIEQRALKVHNMLSGFEPSRGFDLSSLDDRTRLKVEALSEGKQLGSLPAVFINYLDGDALPMELYISKFSKSDPANAASTAFFGMDLAPEVREGYCIVDPTTGIYAEGKTLSEALQVLSKSGYYPPGAILCQSASNGFTSAFEKAGVIGASTVVKHWENKVDVVAGGLGWFSMGCMLAAPDSGGTTAIVGAATGIPAMAWFSFRALQHFIRKQKYENKLFDPTRPDDWREAGMLLTTVFTKGKGGRIIRTAGLGSMVTADLWEFYGEFSKLKKDKKEMTEFLLKRTGQLAASLAMGLYFGKKELSGLNVKPVKTKTAKMGPELSPEQAAETEKINASLAALAETAEKAGNHQLAEAILTGDPSVIKGVQATTTTMKRTKNKAMGLSINADDISAGRETSTQRKERESRERAEKKAAEKSKPKVAEVISKKQVQGKDVVRFRVKTESGDREFYMLNPEVSEKQALDIFGKDFIALDYHSESGLVADHHRPGVTFDPTLPTATTRALEMISRGVSMQNKIPTTNHVDIDSMLSIFSVLNPKLAGKHRALLEEVSRYGDYQVTQSLEAHEMANLLSHIAYGNASTEKKINDIMSLLPEMLEVYGEGKKRTQRIIDLSRESANTYQKGLEIGKSADLRDGIAVLSVKGESYSRYGALDAIAAKAQESNQEVHLYVIVAQYMGGHKISVSQHYFLTESLIRGESTNLAPLPSQNLVDNLNLLEMLKKGVETDWEAIEFLMGETWGGRPGSGIGSPRVDNGTLLEPGTVLDMVKRDAGMTLEPLSDYRFPLARALSADGELRAIVSRPEEMHLNMTREEVLNILKRIYDKGGDEAIENMRANDLLNILRASG